MKNIYKLFFLFLFTSNTFLFGQKDSSSYKRGVVIGLIGGANHFNFWKSPDSKPDFMTGLSAGFHFQYYFSRHFSEVVEFAYENKKYGGNPGKPIELEYYSLPIMVRWHIGQRNLFFLNGGVFVSIISIIDKKNQQQSEILSTSDMGGIIGAGFRIPLTKKTELTLEGRESFSILLSRFPLYENKPVRTNTSFVLLGINYKF